MTIEEYYEILKIEWENVDKDNLQSIKAYNEFKRELKKMVAED